MLNKKTSLDIAKCCASSHPRIKNISQVVNLSRSKYKAWNLAAYLQNHKKDCKLEWNLVAAVGGFQPKLCFSQILRAQAAI